MRSASAGSNGSAVGAPYDSMSRASRGCGCSPGSSPITSAVDPICTRAGAVTSRSYRPPAGTDTRFPDTSVGPLTSRPSTARTWYGVELHTWTAPLSVLTTRTRATCPSDAG